MNDMDDGGSVGARILLNEWLDQRTKAQRAGIAVYFILTLSCMYFAIHAFGRSFSTLTEVEEVVNAADFVAFFGGVHATMPTSYERVGTHSRSQLNTNTTIPVPVFGCTSVGCPGYVSMRDVKFTGPSLDLPFVNVCEILRSYVQNRYWSGLFLFFNPNLLSPFILFVFGFFSFPSLWFLLRILRLSGALFGTNVPTTKNWRDVLFHTNVSSVASSLTSLITADHLIASSILMYAVVALAQFNVFSDVWTSCVFDIAEVSYYNAFWWFGAMASLFAVVPFVFCAYITVWTYQGRYDKTIILTSDSPTTRRWLEFIFNDVYGPQASFFIKAAP